MRGIALAGRGLIACAATAAQPVAIVTDVRGTAAYGAAATPVAILTQLDAGDQCGLRPARA